MRSTETVAQAKEFLGSVFTNVHQSPENFRRMGDVEQYLRDNNPILDLLPLDIMIAGELATVGRALSRQGIKTPEQLLALNQSDAMSIRTIGRKRWAIISAMQVLIQDALQQDDLPKPDLPIPGMG